jgi:hypothetical protein
VSKRSDSVYRGGPESLNITHNNSGRRATNVTSRSSLVAVVKMHLRPRPTKLVAEGVGPASYRQGKAARARLRPRLSTLGSGLKTAGNRAGVESLLRTPGLA